MAKEKEIVVINEYINDDIEIRKRVFNDFFILLIEYEFNNNFDQLINKGEIAKDD